MDCCIKYSHNHNSDQCFIGTKIVEKYIHNLYNEKMQYICNVKMMKFISNITFQKRHKLLPMQIYIEYRIPVLSDLFTINIESRKRFFKRSFLL